MNLYTKLKSVLGSQAFFYFVLVVFVLQAAWIGIHSRFPLPFDESFHLGVIQLYAHQWSPYFSHLPDSTGQFGALATDPSYLYHYLMSFPYRVITYFTHDLVLAVMLLRLINVGLFVGGIILFRRVLRFTNASPALINLSLFIFSLLPLVSFTAAQINYDNLLGSCPDKLAKPCPFVPAYCAVPVIS